jgi:hypothetical protein
LVLNFILSIFSCLKFFDIMASSLKKASSKKDVKKISSVTLKKLDDVAFLMLGRSNDNTARIPIVWKKNNRWTDQVLLGLPRMNAPFKDTNHFRKKPAKKPIDADVPSPAKKRRVAQRKLVVDFQSEQKNNESEMLHKMLQGIATKCRQLLMRRVKRDFKSGKITVDWSANMVYPIVKPDDQYPDRMNLKFPEDADAFVDENQQPVDVDKIDLTQWDLQCTVWLKDYFLYGENLYPRLFLLRARLLPKLDTDVELEDNDVVELDDDDDDDDEHDDHHDHEHRDDHDHDHDHDDDDDSVHAMNTNE